MERVKADQVEVVVIKSPRLKLRRKVIALANTLIQVAPLKLHRLLRIKACITVKRLKQSLKLKLLSLKQKQQQLRPRH